MKSAAVVYVVDLRRMTAFYAAVFGFEVVEEMGDVRVLETSHSSLSLVEIPEAVAREIHLSRPPVRREETPVKLSYAVASIEGLRASVAALGGVMDPPDTAWEYRGFRHCDCVDPEGNVVQLRESLVE